MKEYVCDQCQSKFDTFQAKANHVRWNHLDNSSYSLKMKEIGVEIANRRFGKVVEESVKCSHKNCNNPVEIKYREGKKREKYFCSEYCSRSYSSTSSPLKNEKISKKLTKEKAIKNCPFCRKDFSYREKLNTKYCSFECSNSAKKEKYSLESQYTLKNYRSKASFIFNLSDYPEEFDFTLVEKYGWYKASNRGNNPNGVSRDHMVSVKFGYENKIDPSIISHPANCKLMRHNDNVSKYTDCQITIEELLERIKKWDEKYMGS